MKVPRPRCTRSVAVLVRFMASANAVARLKLDGYELKFDDDDNEQDKDDSSDGKEDGSAS